MDEAYRLEEIPDVSSERDDQFLASDGYVAMIVADTLDIDLPYIRFVLVALQGDG